MRGGAYRAAAELLSLTVLVCIVLLLSVVHDGVDARERVRVARVCAAGRPPQCQARPVSTRPPHPYSPHTARPVTSSGAGRWLVNLTVRIVCLLSIEEDAEAFPVVDSSKDGTHPCPPLCQPHGEPITVEGATLAVYPELEFNLEAIRCEREPAPEPTRLRGPVLAQADVLVGVDNSRPAKVEPPVLEVRVDVGCDSMTEGSGRGCQPRKVRMRTRVSGGGLRAGGLSCD